MKDNVQTSSCNIVTGGLVMNIHLWINETVVTELIVGILVHFQVEQMCSQEKTLFRIRWPHDRGKQMLSPDAEVYGPGQTQAV